MIKTTGLAGEPNASTFINVAQLVEQSIGNRCVVGSNPTINSLHMRNYKSLKVIVQSVSIKIKDLSIKILKLNFESSIKTLSQFVGCRCITFCLYKAV